MTQEVPATLWNYLGTLVYQGVNVLYLKYVKGKGIDYNETSIKEVDLFQHMVVKIKNFITKGRNKPERCSNL